MANRVRGIVVEIGGNTTKLDKALEGTNSKIRSTQAALKDVERLLKLDPSNTVLLEQKERLLADAAQAAGEKLKTLQEAAKGADDALARGTAYEEKYAPLRKTLDETKESLAELQKKQGDMDADFASGQVSDAAYQEFNSALKETRDRLEELNQAKKNLDKEFSGAKLNQEQYDALQRELVEAKDNFQEAEKAADRFGSTLETVENKAGSLSDKAGKLGNALSPFSKAAGGILTAMGAAVPATEEFRTDLSKLETNAQMAGVGLSSMREALKTLNTVSDETDSSVEALSNLLQSNATESNLQRAVQNLAGAAIAFPDTIKIESLADSLQETLATGEATGQFAELLDRLGVSSQVFNQQLSQLPGSADKLNFAIDTLSHQGMANYYSAWVQSNQSLVEGKNASFEFTESLSRLAESLQPIITALTGFATSLFDWFNGLDSFGQKTIITILALVAGISPVAGMVSNVSGAIQGVSKVGEFFTKTAGNKVYLTFNGYSKRKRTLESHGTSGFPGLWTQFGVPLYCDLGREIIGIRPQNHSMAKPSPPLLHILHFSRIFVVLGNSFDRARNRNLCAQIPR